MLPRVPPVAVDLLLFVLLPCLVIGCAAVSGPRLDDLDVHDLAPRVGEGMRVLAVTAHPDDEIAFAGVLYKSASHLDAACDLLVITDGNAGYKYSTLAERVYGAALTDPEVGRARLPAIRRAELIACGEVLGLRRIVFLHQPDPRYTKDPGEVLAAGEAGWDLVRVRRALDAVLRAGRYDFVLTHLPVPDTHGHHKAATILALEAVAALPEAERPVVLGAYHRLQAGAAPVVPDALDGYEITRIRRDIGPFEFDRTQRFGYRDQLDYHIVVNWAIAAHRSQGTMQKLMGKSDVEGFFAYALAGPASGPARVADWFRRLAEPQFEARTYPE
ncbi:MAG: PIG-L family deacetylase [Planctomycetota bacterium]